METKKYTLLIGTSVFIALMTACHPKDREDLNAQIEWTEVSRSSSYTDEELLAFEDTIGLGQAAFSAEMRIFSPSTGNRSLQPVVDSLKVQIMIRIVSERPSVLSVEEAVDRHITNLLDEYKADLEQAKKMTTYEHEDIGSSLHLFVHQHSMTDSITFNRSNVLSLVSRLEDFTGGAHGISSASALNYDLEQNKCITFGLLFVPGYEDIINQMVQRELLLSFGVTRPEDLQGEGVYNYENAKVAENFFLTEEGVTFYYNPYEIGAYFLGTIKLTLPYASIRNYIQDDYKRIVK